MKIKEGFMLREVAGNYIVIGAADGLNFNNIITVNEIGAIIWQGIEEGKEKSQIIEAITSEYDIDTQTAGEDFDAFTKQLVDCGVME